MALAAPVTASLRWGGAASLLSSFHPETQPAPFRCCVKSGAPCLQCSLISQAPPASPCAPCPLPGALPPGASPAVVLEIVGCRRQEAPSSEAPGRSFGSLEKRLSSPRESGPAVGTQEESSTLRIRGASFSPHAELRTCKEPQRGREQ